MPMEMCSTPYGITAINSCPPGGRMHRRNGVLNALRHHSYQQQPAPLRDCWGSRCAQRLTASQLSTARSRRCGAYPGAWCSTPYGITAINSCAPVTLFCTVTCAQRLTASQLSTGRLPRLWSEILMCSTPYGITAINRWAELRAHEFLARCSTPYGITAINSIRCTPGLTSIGRAQRLTASQLSTGTPLQPLEITPIKNLVFKHLPSALSDPIQTHLLRPVNNFFSPSLQALFSQIKHLPHLHFSPFLNYLNRLSLSYPPPVSNAQRCLICWLSNSTPSDRPS